MPGTLASLGLIAHGSHGVLDNTQALMNAINSTNHAGPLSQFGGALFGARGADIGASLDAALSVRGALKSAKDFFSGTVNAGSTQGVSSTSKKLFDQAQQDNQVCRVGS